MIEIAHTGTPLLYAGFTLLVVVLLLVDFMALKVQGAHKVSVKEAAIWSGCTAPKLRRRKPSSI